eukprot:7023827-Prymnesium_polylepis.3
MPSHVSATEWNQKAPKCVPSMPACHAVVHRTSAAPSLCCGPDHTIPKKSGEVTHTHRAWTLFSLSRLRAIDGLALRAIPHLVADAHVSGALQKTRK